MDKMFLRAEALDMGGCNMRGGVGGGRGGAEGGEGDGRKDNNQ